MQPVPTTVAPPEATVPAPATPAPTSPPVTVKGKPAWNLVPGKWPAFFQNQAGGTHMIGRRYAVHPDPSDFSVHVVTRRDSGKVILRHRAAKGYETAFAGVHGEILVLADGNAFSSNPRPQHIFFFDLRSGKKIRGIRDIIGKDYEPGATALQDSLATTGHYYLTVSPVKDRRFGCVGRVDLATWLFETISDCDRLTDAIYYGSPGDAGHTWLTMRSENPSDDAGRVCQMGEAFQRNKRIRIGGEDNCSVWYTGLVADSAGGEPWQVWTERDPEVGPEGPVFASNGAELIRLGESNGLILYSCGGYAYWSQQLDDSSLVTADEVEFGYLRWRPGGPIELVWVVPKEGWPITLNSCNEGILTVVTMDFESKQSRVRYLKSEK